MDVIRQSENFSCAAAVGEMLTKGALSERLLIQELGTPSDIISLAKKLGDGWTSESRQFTSVADIGKFGPWAAEVSDIYTRKKPHIVFVEGLTSTGNVQIRDPFEGTKYEMNLEYFRHEAWTGQAAYRIKPDLM